ncbi:MAG TPA: hypothetical protein VIK18_10545 [Pirellulales bacterium]
MIRLVAVLFTALFCTGCQGCQSPRQPVDPFLGRTTVPPPPTGIIGPAGSVPPDSGGFLQRAPATNPATENQFTPPESNNDLYAPPEINNGIPAGSYGGGYQSSAPPPQNGRWARANPNRTATAPANVQLTSGSQPWLPAQTDATAAAASAPATTPVSQIRIVPSSAGAGGSDPTDIMNLPPKTSSPATGGATM